MTMSFDIDFNNKPIVRRGLEIMLLLFSTQGLLDSFSEKEKELVFFLYCPHVMLS